MKSEAAQADVLDDETCARLESDLRSALRRKPAQEARLAGVLRALMPFSTRLRRAAVSPTDTLVRRGSFDRPLYAAAMRGLAAAEAPEASELIARALAEEGGGLA